MALTSLTRPRRRGMGRRREWLHPLEREMKGMFDDFQLSPFDEMLGWPSPYMPPVNVCEQDNQVVVTAELPGLRNKDIEVTVNKDTVRISGEKKEETEAKEEDFYRMESVYGRFDRTIELPTAVDDDHGDAKFVNGILTVTIPKSKESESGTKKIPVKSG